MKKYLSDQLVSLAMRREPKTIKDDLFLLAWCWTKEDMEDEVSRRFLEQLGKIYTYLLKHTNPETLSREKRKILENDPILREQYESTEELRTQVSTGQTVLPWAETHRRIAEVKKMLDSRVAQ